MSSVATEASLSEEVGGGRQKEKGAAPKKRRLLAQLRELEESQEERVKRKQFVLIRLCGTHGV